MKKKTFIIINSIIIFVLATIGHFIYDFFPNDFTAIFFPVNESIWEHMKLLFTPFFIDLFIIFVAFKKLNIVYHNLLFSALISALFAIFIYIVIYLPVFLFFGYHIVFTIGLLFVIIVVSQFLQFKILKKEVSNYSNFSLIMTIIVYIVFGYLTYHPFRNFVFYDMNDKKYGINIYALGN